MIQVGPLFFGGTRGGYGRIYTAGPKAANRGVAMQGVDWLSTMSRAYLPGGGVRLSGKEDGRDTI
jgi:hypothetical protein